MRHAKRAKTINQAVTTPRKAILVAEVLRDC
jgi:hypothetical protein